MSYTIEIEDIELDRGYGPEYGVLQLEVSPIFTDERFDAHNGFGDLQLYGNSNALTDFEIDDAVIFLIDRDGGEYAEIDGFSDDEIFDKYIEKDDLLDKLINLHY